MSIPQPYLLFLGDVTDPLSAKTARGIYQWRPQQCLGQLRLTADTVSLGLQDMALAQAKALGAKTLVLGTANAGGIIPPHWLAGIVDAINLGFNIASGMHQRLSDIPQVASAAKTAGVFLFDVRHFDGFLKVGNGHKRSGKRLLTVGSDCSVGKMFTSLALEKAIRAQGESARFRATGQTGILIDGGGISIDAVVADFISGAVEAISPATQESGWDIIEGQGSLFNPSFAGVSLGLLHGAQADALVLCHEIGRTHIRNLPHMPMPNISDVLEANITAARLTNPEVKCVGISLNTSSIHVEDAKLLCQQWEVKYGVPVTDPVRFGIDNIAKNLLPVPEAEIV